MREKQIHKSAFSGAAGILLLLLVILSVSSQAWAREGQIRRIVSVSIQGPLVLAVPKDIEASKLGERLTEIKVQVVYENGEKELFSPIWETGRIDIQRVGLYEAEGRLSLPEYTILGEGVSLPELRAVVSVQKWGEPQISSFYMLENTDLCVFPWLSYPASGKMEAWLSRDNGEWECLTEAGTASCYEDGLYMSTQCLRNASVHRLLVGYPAGQTKVLRFLYWDGAIQVLSYESGSMEDGPAISQNTEILSLEPDMDTERVFAYAAAPGADLREFYKALAEIGFKGSTEESFCDTEQSPAIHLSVRWDTSGIYTNTPGVYLVQGTLKAPEGYSFGEGVSLPSVTAYLSIQKTEEPRMNTYYAPDKDSFFFPMVMDKINAKQKDEVHIFLRENEKEWKDITEEGARTEESGMTLKACVLKMGSSYELCLEYGEEDTGIYSFDFQEGKLENGKYIWAGRDGIRVTPAPESLIQKIEEENTAAYGYTAGNTSSSASGSSTSSYQYYTWEDYEKEKKKYTQKEETTSGITYTGSKIAELLKEQGESVAFEENGNIVYLTKNFLEGLGLGADETVEVTLESKEERCLRLTVRARGAVVSDIGETTVTMPLTLQEGEEGVFQVLAEDESIQGEATVDMELGTASFTISRTGEYRLEAVETSWEDFPTEGISDIPVIEDEFQGEEFMDEEPENIDFSENELLEMDSESEEVKDESPKTFPEFNKRFLLFIPAVLLGVGILALILRRKKHK